MAQLKNLIVTGETRFSDKAFHSSQIVGTNTCGSWIASRDTALLRNDSYSSGSYSVALAQKTTSGYWSIGNLNNSGDERLYFTYATNTNYSAGTNTTTNLTIDTAGLFSGTSRYVYNVLTAPTTGTWYYPTWITGTANGKYEIKTNDGFRYYCLQGTASALGHSHLQIGNATASGTDGNKQGHLRIYDSNSYYTSFEHTSGTLTASRTIIIPNVGGTMLTTSNGLPLAGGTMTGDITFTATGTTGASKGLSWSGSTDGVKIYYNAVASDQGLLYIESTDDANSGARFRNASSGRYVDVTNGYIIKNGVNVPGVYIGSGTGAQTGDILFL